MSFRNGSGPEAAATVLEARKNVGIGNAAPSKPSPRQFASHLELDAINPDGLRALVQGTIERHLPPRQFEVLKAAEASEREIITKLVGGLGS